MRFALPAAFLWLLAGPAAAQTPSVDVGAALQTLATARDTSTRMAAAAELGRSRDPRALEALLGALRDQNRDVRWVAIEALGELGDRRAVQPLVQYLRRKEDYRWGKRLVADALGEIGGSQAVEALSAMLADGDLFVRRLAALALLRQGDTRLLPRVAELLRESPDDHLATVKREFAKLRDGAGPRPDATAVAGAGVQAGPVKAHEWLGLKVGRSTLADATERLGTALQRTSDAFLFRGDAVPSPLRTESIAVNGPPDGPIESIFVFPMWGTLDRDVRAVFGSGRLLTYGEFLRMTGRAAAGAGTKADGKLHYLPVDLMAESFSELGILVVYDSADVAARDRLVKLVIIY